jgi:hypothetical protein
LQAALQECASWPTTLANDPALTDCAWASPAYCNARPHPGAEHQQEHNDDDAASVGNGIGDCSAKLLAELLYAQAIADLQLSNGS